ncbi:MAG: hypothetical protein FWH21_05405 [Kiritimatiellaeota bacterium]|nr:hypothetical protein [Kiritimatiellota bacterium]
MNDIQPLLELQDIDGHIRTLQQEAKDLPKRKEAEALRLQELQAALELAKSELKAAQVRVAEAELEVKARNDKILALKQSQGQLKTNKEFLAYNLEIAKIEAEIENHEARQIVAMDDVIPCKQACVEKEAVLKEGHQEVDAYCAELDARLAEVKTELTALGTARGNAVKQVQPRALSYYERMITNRWPVVVQLQADGVCKGCNLRQPPSVAQMVRRGQELTPCQMCGRLLYM